MKALVINLADAGERMAFQARQLEAQGIRCERLEAIDRTGVSPPPDDAYWTGWERPLRITEMAALCSHRAAWRRITADRFRETYFDTLAVHPLRPDDPGFEAALLDLFVIQKAAYEVGYELSMRPGWVSVPIAGLLGILGNQEALDART